MLVLTLCAAPAEARIFVGVGVPVPVMGLLSASAYVVYYPPAFVYPGGGFIGAILGPITTATGTIGDRQASGIAVRHCV
jgi:hypothetical protein